MRKYTVVENAGHEGETDIETFASRSQAFRYMLEIYSEDELEELHVAIRTDYSDGTSEY